MSRYPNIISAYDIAGSRDTDGRDDLEFVRGVIARALIAAISRMAPDEFRAVIANFRPSAAGQ